MRWFAKLAALALLAVGGGCASLAPRRPRAAGPVLRREGRRLREDGLAAVGRR